MSDPATHNQLAVYSCYDTSGYQRAILLLRNAAPKTGALKQRTVKTRFGAGPATHCALRLSVVHISSYQHNQ